MFKKVAIILALLVCTSFAQKDDPFIAAHSKAVLFSFSGIDAKDFQGGAGIKFFITSPMALRFGVMVNVAGSTTPANPVGTQVGVDGSTSSTTFGVNAALEYHVTSTRLTPYFGGGIGFSTISNERKPAVVGPSAPVYQFTFKNEAGAGTSINFFALMGFEYFIVNEVSLAAEYRLGYSLLSPSDLVVSSSDPAITSVTTKGISTHSLYLNSAGFLTLAVYF